MTMKRFLIGLCTATLLPAVLAPVSLAQSHPVPLRLSPAQLQQISGALTRFDSQDFFTRGREQLENEVKLLTERKLFLSEGVLKISRDLQIQPELAPLERPDVFSPPPIK